MPSSEAAFAAQMATAGLRGAAGRDGLTPAERLVQRCAEERLKVPGGAASSTGEQASVASKAEAVRGPSPAEVELDRQAREVALKIGVRLRTAVGKVFRVGGEEDEVDRASTSEALREAEQALRDRAVLEALLAFSRGPDPPWSPSGRRRAGSTPSLRPRSPPATRLVQSRAESGARAARAASVQRGSRARGSARTRRFVQRLRPPWPRAPSAFRRPPACWQSTRRGRPRRRTGRLCPVARARPQALVAPRRSPDRAFERARRCAECRATSRCR